MCVDDSRYDVFVLPVDNYVHEDDVHDSVFARTSRVGGSSVAVKDLQKTL